MQRREFKIVSLPQLLRGYRIPLDQTEVGRRILRLSNDERIARRLNCLEQHAGLDRVAADHSRDMALRGYFDHRDPEGKDALDRVEAGCRQLIVQRAGENIACLTVDGDAAWVASELVQGWMESPGHRANILDAGWTHLGVGLWRRGNCVWATQVFVGLLAELDGAPPGRVRHGAEVRIRFRVYPRWHRPGEVEAIVQVPDRQLLIDHGSGYSGAGWYPAPCHWKGSTLCVHFVPRHGPGQYEIGLARRGIHQFVPAFRVMVV